MPPVALTGADFVKIRGSPMGKKQLLRRNYDVFLFLAAMLPVAVMVFAKCKYGIGNWDESFYLTVPYRLCQGDRLFLNE